MEYFADYLICISNFPKPESENGSLGDQCGKRKTVSAILGPQ